MKKFAKILAILFIGWLGGIATALLVDDIVNDQIDRMGAAADAYQKDQ